MENTTFPTKRQKRAIEAVAQGKSVSRAMLEAGYSPATAKNPRNLTSSKGFREVCEANGLTDSLIIKALVSDIKSKPTKRVPELTLGAEILGMKKQQEHGNTTNILNIIAPEQAERIARRVLDGDAESAGTLNRLSDSNQPEV